MAGKDLLFHWLRSVPRAGTASSLGHASRNIPGIPLAQNRWLWHDAVDIPREEFRHEETACSQRSVERRCGHAWCDDVPALGQDGKGKAKAEQPASPNYPAWAYAIPPAPPPGATPPAPVDDDGKMLTLPGTDLQFTFNKVRGRVSNENQDRTSPADWYPGDHPTMPKIVSDGDSARNIIACALCHLPPGKGRPENAPPMANPAGYTVQQLMDFKNGLRKSGDPRKGNTNNMINFAKAMTDQEMHDAAAYYAAQKWTPWIRVVESAQAPKVRSQAGMWIPLQGADAGMEPIGAASSRRLRIRNTPRRCAARARASSLTFRSARSPRDSRSS